MMNRKVTYRLYPTKTQANTLSETLAIHQRVYNAALEERIRVYKAEDRSLTFVDQCKALTQWRKAHSSLAVLNAQSLQVTLKRLDLAFQGFYRRLKTKEKAGFPRFKSIQRYRGWGYKTHGDGFRFIEGKNSAHGTIKLSGIGTIKLRGKARTVGTIKTGEILYKSGKWYASITIACEPKRRCGTKAMGLDWGVASFLTTHDSEEKTQTIDNPRHIKSILPALKTLQQAVARKKNKQSHNRKKVIKKLSRLHAQVANRRKNFHHQEAAKIVAENGLIAVEALSVKTMTASGGNYKKGLNREILSTAPSQFHHLLKSKAEEAGALWIEIPTRKVKPSQTCYRCFKQSKKLLSERVHRCDCGVICSRDENAARVILNWALRWVSGQELAELGSHRWLMTLNQETPAIP